MATVPADVEGPSDAELIQAVRKGTVSAYGALYERHVASAYNLARQLSRSPAEADDLVSEAFAKVLDTLRGGRGPDSAFRAYLLTALRHTAYDRTRRERRVELSDDVSTVSGVAMAALSEEFDDPAVAGLERSLAAQAFARLPERWQAVLWHTEIEGQSPAEVAPILGLTPNGVSALSYRAREGLRQEYLQVHLAETEDKQCRAAAERLGAWTRGGLARREKAQVETHLDMCERCRSLADELADVNGAMRLFVAPVVLGLGAIGYLATTPATTAAAGVVAAGGAAGSVGAAAAAGPRQFLGVAASSVAMAAAIVVGLASSAERPEIPAVAAPTPTQEQEPPPVTSAPPQQQPPPQQPPQQPAEPAREPTREPTPAAEEPPPAEPGEPAQQEEPGAPQLDASAPSAPVSLVAGGAPVDLPLTIRNTGATVSEPVVAVLTLPAGVSAVGFDRVAAPRLLSLSGAKAGTVACPAGAGTVTCANGGLAPGESVTLLFRLQASGDARSGQITGFVSAGADVRIAVTLRVDVQAAPVRDDLALAAESDWLDLLGDLFVPPRVKVTVTNSGTSSLPVTLTVDQEATLHSSSQDVKCRPAGAATTCTTAAEVAPGETLEVVLTIQGTWQEGLLHPKQVHVTATLGTATKTAAVTVYRCLWPVQPPAAEPPPQTTQPVPPTSEKTPPTSENPPAQTPADEPPPAPSTPPPPTTTPPTSTTAPAPTTEERPSVPTPSPPAPPSGGLGGLLGWLLGG